MPSAAFIPWSNVEVHVLGCKYHIIRSVNWHSGVRVTRELGLGYLGAHFSLPRPLCSQLIGPMYATDVRRQRLIIT